MNLTEARAHFTGPSSPGSHNRLPVLLDVCLSLSHEDAARLFMEEWSGCDVTTPYATETSFLLQAIRDHMAFPDWLPTEPFTVYRGCDESNKRGISWTTSKEVAETFARGHRVPNPNPCLQEREIEPEQVLWATNDRDEWEVLMKPVALPKTRF